MCVPIATRLKTIVTFRKINRHRLCFVYSLHRTTDVNYRSDMFDSTGHHCMSNVAVYGLVSHWSNIFAAFNSDRTYDGKPSNSVVRCRIERWIDGKPLEQYLCRIQ
eukprot:212873_1